MKTLVLVHPPFKSTENDNSFVKPLFTFSSCDFEIQPFSWKKSFSSPYKIIHVHWIEHLVGSPNILKSILKGLLSLALIFHVHFFKIAIVNTRHNLLPHAKINNPVSRLAYSLWTKSIDVEILMNRFEYSESSPRKFLIPHHIYFEDKYQNYIVPMRSLPSNQFFICFGRMDKARMTIELIRNFGTFAPDTQLLLVGEIPNKKYLSRVLNEIARFPNVSVIPQKIGQVELDRLIFNSAGVIGPLNNFHNTGVVFHVINHKKPILIFDNETSRELQLEFGAELITIDAKPLSRAPLIAFIKSCKEVSKIDFPDVSIERLPSKFYEKHIQVYYSTVSLTEAK
jgi:hypothetical protein